jgi:hypothetical protein
MMLIVAAGYERLAAHARSVERSGLAARSGENWLPTRRGSRRSSQLVATRDTWQADKGCPLGSAPRAGRPAWRHNARGACEGMRGSMPERPVKRLRIAALLFCRPSDIADE